MESDATRLNKRLQEDRCSGSVAVVCSLLFLSDVVTAAAMRRDDDEEGGRR